MQTKDYTYAVARIKYREKFCLDKQTLSSLAGAKTVEEAMRLLNDKGWEGSNYLDIADNQLKELSKLMGELTDKEEFRSFFLENDYHNIKAAVKNSFNPTAAEIFLADGTVTVKEIKDAVEAEDFGKLPGQMAKTAAEALKTLRETGDGQLCDVIVDAGFLADIQKADGLFKMYGQHIAAVADIKIALRGAKANKSRDFFGRALVETKDVDKAALTEAAVKGVDSVYEYLAKTPFAKCFKADMSIAASETACDNLLNSRIKIYKNEFFGIEPIAAYYLGRLNEIKTVRMLLTAKANGVEAEYVKERLRDAYV